jgi:predicted nucleotide-binding protein
VATPTENDAHIVLGVLVQAQRAAEAANVDQITDELSGVEIQSRSDLSPERINRSVDLLESWGFAHVRRTFGNRPFDFFSASVTATGRLEHERLESDPSRAVDRRAVPGGDGRALSEKIFVVHGRDDGLRDQVARVIERLGLKPLILMEEPNEGRTIIEKFEEKALDVGFAVVLLTADDLGHAHDEPTPSAPNRARQNVVLELGYFMGVLGRARVAALYQEGVELPSDIHGLGYIVLDLARAWRYKLAEELAAAGYPIDFNRLR